MVRARFATWRTWTRKEEAHLISLRARGLSLGRIAAEMRRTVSSVRQRCHHLDAPKAGYLERYYGLLSKPHRLADVASREGVSVQMVKNAKTALRRLGLAVQPATWDWKSTHQRKAAP